MSPAQFKTLCQTRHRELVAQGEAVPILSPGESFALELYRAVRERTNSPIKRVLTTVVSTEALEHGLDLSRSRIAALDMMQADQETINDWHRHEATLVALLELLTGGPEQTT